MSGPVFNCEVLNELIWKELIDSQTHLSPSQTLTSGTFLWQIRNMKITPSMMLKPISMNGMFTTTSFSTTTTFSFLADVSSMVALWEGVKRKDRNCQLHSTHTVTLEETDKQNVTFTHNPDKCSVCVHTSFR